MTFWAVGWGNFAAQTKQQMNLQSYLETTQGAIMPEGAIKLRQLLIDLNGRTLTEGVNAYYSVTTDTPTLGALARAAGVMCDTPTSINPHFHLWFNDGSVSICVRGPIQVAKVTYEEQ